MAKLPHVRQVIDPAPKSGAWNMAVDEVMLRSAIEDGIATLRWYAWREPTVSLGYFQREVDVLNDSRLAKLPRVRRLSGGGTLVHDRELTYSLALPSSQRLIAHPVELYRVVHQSILGVLSSRGANVALRGVTTRLQHEPTLCFAREDEHDLVLNGCKILGSAQRRRRGAILQHGGLLLGASQVTPELRGIENLCPTANLAGLPEALGRAILAEIAETFSYEPLTQQELELARHLASC